MPVVTIKLARGRSAAQKRELVGAVTATLVKTMDVKPEWVTVLIDEYERENWATAGVLHSDAFGPGCGKKTRRTGKKK